MSDIDEQSDLEMLRDRLRAFADERDWEQFHSPKNLSMALMVEVAELMEHFQWLTEAQSTGLPEETRPTACCTWCAWPTAWAWT